MASAKMTGAVLKQYLQDKDQLIWPEGRYYDDALFTVNEIEVDDLDDKELKDDDRCTIEGGIVLDPDTPLADGIDFATHFKQWLKKQNTTLLVVRVPNENIDAVKQALKSAKATIV